ncbi:MAG: transpeptidase family protein [Bacteroidetes bacterium]|nr:transpeptidase family protein [Bacteroidota bacterium]
MNVKKDIRFRVYIAFTCMCIMGVAIICRAAYLQIKEGKELRQMSYNMHMKADTMYAERGNIYTENGELLCSSIPQFDIHLDPTVVKKDSFFKYVDTLSRGIYSILQIKSPAIIKSELVRAYNDSNHYFRLAKDVTYDKYLALRSLPIFKLGKRRGGFIADADTKRINPYGSLAFRTIGLWRKNARNVGLEGTFDSVLSGTNGSRLMQRMTGGVYMPVEGTEIDPQNGEDIITTIDLNIQNVAEHAMMQVLEKYNCLYGTAVVMEVNTGKIAALVNLGYDTKTNSYLENQNYALIPAEPGSTFKLVTLMSLLNDKLINVNDIVDCEGGRIQFGPRVMKDSHFGLGRITIRDAYAHSSNAAMAKLAWQFYSKDPEKYIKHLEAFGIDKRTGIDIAGEPRPHVIKPGSKEWSGTTLPWMATGYGVMINPIRTAMLYNGVANGGKMMRPYLVSGVKQYGKEIQHFDPEVIMQMGDSSAIAQMQSCTREVVLSGTGRHIKSPNYEISGKTGTAQVADLIDGKWYGYGAKIYQGSFVGYFPSDKPRYTICVAIRTKPHSSSYYGGTLAAPVFRMISDKIFASGMGTWKSPLDSIERSTKKGYYGRQATGASYQELMATLGMKAAKNVGNNRVVVQAATDSSQRMVLRAKPAIRGVVPDVSGMSLKDAVYLLEKQGMKVLVEGRGSVRSQSIAAGVAVGNGQSIIIQLG